MNSKQQNDDQDGTIISFEEACHLQAMENNPLDADDLAMFEMFEREGWSQQQRRDYILAKANQAAMVPAAE